MQPTPEGNPIVGVVNGLLLVLPFWSGAIWWLLRE